MLADDLVEHSARRITGRVPQERDGRMAVIAGSGLPSHETGAWQPHAARASLRVDSGLLLCDAERAHRADVELRRTLSEGTASERPSNDADGPFSATSQPPPRAL